jgi:hypothetical protein
VCVYTRRPTALLLVERWSFRPVKPPGCSSFVCTEVWESPEEMVCEGEARPNQRAPASVYQQMRPKLVAMGKEQRPASTCDGSNVRNTVLDLRDLPNR